MAALRILLIAFISLIAIVGILGTFISVPQSPATQMLGEFGSHLLSFVLAAFAGLTVYGLIRETAWSKPLAWTLCFALAAVAGNSGGFLLGSLVTLYWIGMPASSNSTADESEPRTR